MKKALLSKLDKAEAMENLSTSASSKDSSPRFMLQRLLKKLKLKVSHKALDLIEDGDSFGIVNKHQRYVGASNDLLSLFSWSFEQILTLKLSELFVIDKAYSKRLAKVFMTVFTTRAIVHNPCAYHQVTEAKSTPTAFGAVYKALAPVFDESNKIIGVLAIGKITQNNQQVASGKPIQLT